MWQDDPATIHRTPVALEACSAFKTRVPHEIQAPKMADIWPIENVWAILKEGVKAKEPKSKAQLKKVITQVWRQMDRDKDMCKRLITSIPNRLKAVINVGGRQVTKADYRQIEAEE